MNSIKLSMFNVFYINLCLKAPCAMSSRHFTLGGASILKRVRACTYCKCTAWTERTLQRKQPHPLCVLFLSALVVWHDVAHAFAHKRGGARTKQ
jgi:hypothetical protein